MFQGGMRISDHARASGSILSTARGEKHLTFSRPLLRSLGRCYQIHRFYSVYRVSLFPDSYAHSAKRLSFRDISALDKPS